jgi:hypothetical protein
MADDTPIAWRAITYATPVLAADGSTVGKVREVLGSDAEDIFHGIRVNLDGGTGDDVVVPAADVTTMTSRVIETRLSAEEIRTQPHFTDEGTYHLASVGWLRRHLGWARDSKDDEEPG